ncbi:OmpA/MotB [Methylophilales bacterium HTCC2181]|uniref:OmpA/MotB n=1 Tax=Methylophilales bacterium HTCC2181 TaxID=383631 RepID=A0P5F6_9PROT|nr:OmpA/MotB [Methylophilales bacterium HTCC2181]
MKFQPFIAALLFALTTQVYAEGVYVGIAGGKLNTETSVTGLTGTASLNEDEDDTGYKLFAGYRASNNFGVELHYADLGEASLSGNIGDTFISNGVTYGFTANGVKIVQETKSYGAAATYALPLNDSFSLLGKIGFHRWDIEDSQGFDEDGTEPFYGIGASYQVNENVAIQAEFERFQIDSIDVDDIDLLSVGLAFHF